MIGKVMLFLALVCCATAAIDSCKQAGEYCLNHWDCCTNTCLSYLYKCSSIQQPKPPGGFVQGPALFASPGIPQTETVSLDSLLEIVFRPLKTVPQSGREVNEINSRIGVDKVADEEVTTINPTTDGPQCLEIGSKCYTNDECCTQRCHGFLHQCVT